MSQEQSPKLTERSEFLLRGASELRPFATPDDRQYAVAWFETDGPYLFRVTGKRVRNYTPVDRWTRADDRAWHFIAAQLKAEEAARLEACLDLGPVDIETGLPNEALGVLLSIP